MANKEKLPQALCESALSIVRRLAKYDRIDEQKKRLDDLLIEALMDRGELFTQEVKEVFHGQIFIYKDVLDDVQTWYDEYLAHQAMTNSAGQGRSGVGPLPTATRL